MHRREASPKLRLARRLLGVAALVALVALLVTALGVGSARAQVQPPADVAPGVSVPGAAVVPDPDYEDDDDADRPREDGSVLQPAPPLPGLIGDDGWQIPEQEELPPVRRTYVAGRVARMRTDGRAAIPRGAPKRVRSLIAHYNRVAGKRYKWGGGHARLVDSGYDCSGAVGYGLIKAGLLRKTMVSGSFARWGAAGAGRWVTVYAHRSHVYVEIAGVRLDTSSIGDRGGRSGVRWRPAIGQRPGFKARHPVGL